MIELSKAVGSRIMGDDYQAYIFWIKACTLLIQNAKKIAYEYDKVKSIDDVVLFYDEPVLDEFNDPVYTDYYQIKYHVTQNGSIKWEDLLDPNFINASSVSFLQRVYEAQKSKAPNGKGCRFYLVSSWQVHPDNDLAKILSNSGGELRWDKLSQGGERSRMGRIRKAMRTHLGIKTDEQLKVVLRPLRILHNTANLKKIKDELNLNLIAAGLKPIDNGKITNPYIDIIKGLFIKGKNEFTREDIITICKREGLWVGNNVAKSSEISIGIQSFVRGSENMKRDTKYMLCLLDFFEGRKIKDQTNWNTIVNKVENFIASSTKDSVSYAIHLDTHCSIAFTAGYFLDSKLGVDIAPIQKFNGRHVWRTEKNIKYEEYPGWQYEEHIRDQNANDLVLTLGITHKIIDDVNYYLDHEGLTIHRVINCTIDGGPGGAVIQNGSHAWVLADKIACFINERPINERIGQIHIFSAVPNALIFFIGQFARSFGKCTVYEYDFESGLPGKYEPSITLPLTKEEKGD